MLKIQNKTIEIIIFYFWSLMFLSLAFVSGLVLRISYLPDKINPSSAFIIRHS